MTKPKDYVDGSPGEVDHDFVDLDGYPFGLDVRYARADNFVGRAVYPAEKAFLQSPVAESLLRVHEALSPRGFGILVFDGYRPWSVTKLFHDLADERQREFLARPETGSTHNRGCAVDCTLFRLKDGREVRMTSDFDEMNESAWPSFSGGTPEERRNRDLLVSAMSEEGFRVLRNEWWHFNHESAGRYPIYDWSFEVLSAELSINGRRASVPRS